MAVPTDFYTADMVRALPDDGNRYETVYGELLVSPAPRGWHQEITLRLVIELRRYLERERVGHAMLSPADISWGADSLVQPDVFVVALDQARTMEWANMKDLRLVAEILSPGTTRYDRFTKRRLYQAIGIPVYWVIDGDDRSVEIWSPDSSFPVIERDIIRWSPAGASAALELELETLFRRM